MQVMSLTSPNNKKSFMSIFETIGIVWKKVAMAFVILLFVPVFSNAQNNQYKIKDNLYQYYRRAVKAVKTPRCLPLADSLYHKSLAQGDKKAACLALTVMVKHYRVMNDDRNQIKTCNRLDKEARAFGYLQYSYFAKSSITTLYINSNQFLLAMQAIEEMDTQAHLDNYPYGIAMAIRSRANLYQIQKDYDAAAKFMKEAAEYMKANVPEQDVAPTYARLSRIYLHNDNPQEAKRYAEEALATVKNPENLGDIIYCLLESYYLMSYKDPVYKQKFLEKYKEYEKVLLSEKKDERRFRTYIEKLLMEGNYAKADSLIATDASYLSFNIQQRLYASRGDYQKVLFMNREYEDRSDQIHLKESPAYMLAEFNASFAHTQLAQDRARLEYEMAKQKLMKANTDADLEAKLTENASMQLANDSLVMSKMKTDSVKMAYEKSAKASELALIRSKAELKNYLMIGAVVFLVLLFCYAVMFFLKARRNINDLKAKRRELQKQLDHAEESERMKTAFVKNLSYDIRTPLNSVVGFTDIMLNASEGLSDEEKEVFKEKIELNSTALTTLVNDILQLSYIQSERQVIEKKTYNINEIIAEAIETARKDCKPGIRIYDYLDESDDVSFVTDKQLVVTALSRAIVFATHHTVSREVSLEAMPNDGHFTQVVISYAIDDDMKCTEQMFSGACFFNEEMEGYKMSLPVSRAALERLGGTIRFVDSVKGLAQLLISHPLKTVLALFVMLSSLVVPQTAKAQFAKDILDRPTYKLYLEAQNKRELKEGLELARKLYNQGVRTGNKHVQCVALSVELQHHVMNSNDNQAFATIDKLQKLALEVHDTLYYYMAFSNEIAIHLNNKHTLTALKRCLQQREITEKNHDIYGIYTTYRSLGDIYRVRKNYKKAHQCYVAALELYEKYDIKHDPTMTLVRMAEMMRLDANYDACIKYVEKVRTLARIERYRYLANLEEAFHAFETNDTARFRRMVAKAKMQKEKHGFRYPDKEKLLALQEMVVDGKDGQMFAKAVKELPEREYFHFLTAVFINEQQWAPALAHYEQEMKVKHRQMAAIYESDRKEMNEIIGNNNLSTENMRLKLIAANLEIERKKAQVELDKSEQNKRQLLVANNKLAMSRMAAQASLDSLGMEKDRLSYIKEKVEETRLTAMVVVALSFLAFFLLCLMIYKRYNSLQAKRLEEKNREIEEAKKHAEMSDHLKTIFIQNMSHEIRTPLNAIVGFSQLMLTPGFELDETEKKEFAKTIRHNSELLTTLVGDIISLSELESGRYVMNIQSHVLNDLCRMALETVKHRKTPDVELCFETAFDNSFMFNTDGQRVEQVLINYLTNAIKYTKQGRITLGVRPVEDNTWIEFSVTDTGQGIPLDKQKEIFERFSKLDSFHQGTGLGLNICRLIAEKLDGIVMVDPEYTAGARFLLKLKV